MDSSLFFLAKIFFRIWLLRRTIKEFQATLALLYLLLFLLPHFLTELKALAIIHSFISVFLFPSVSCTFTHVFLDAWTILH